MQNAAVPGRYPVPIQVEYTFTWPLNSKRLRIRIQSDSKNRTGSGSDPAATNLNEKGFSNNTQFKILQKSRILLMTRFVLQIKSFFLIM